MEVYRHDVMGVGVSSSHVVSPSWLICLTVSMVSGKDSIGLSGDVSSLRKVNIVSGGRVAGHSSPAPAGSRSPPLLSQWAQFAWPIDMGQLAG